MIIDSNLMLFEGAVSTKTGDPVGLTSLHIPGKAEPIPVLLRCTETLAGATSVTVKLQQSDAADGTFTDVPGSALTLAAADFKVGKLAGWRFLPRGAVKQWLRLDVAVTGTATAGALFCAVMREEDEGYEAGQYINKGVTVG